MEFVTKLVEGKFPTTTASIPKNHKNTHHPGPRRALLNTLQRTAILTSDKFKGVRLNIDPGSLRVASNNAEQEEAVDELDIDYGGDSIEIGFNVTYLIDALDQHERRTWSSWSCLTATARRCSPFPTTPPSSTWCMPMRI